MVASASATAQKDHDDSQVDEDEDAGEHEASAKGGVEDLDEVHPPPGAADHADNIESGGLATCISVATSGSVRHSRTTSFADFLPGGGLPGGGASMSTYVSVANLDATPEGHRSANAMFGTWAGENRRSQWKALQWAVQVGMGTIYCRCRLSRLV